MNGNLSDLGGADGDRGWNLIYHGLSTSATNVNYTTGNVLTVSGNIRFDEMKIEAVNWNYSITRQTTETARMKNTFSWYYEWLHAQPDTPNPNIKFHAAYSEDQDVQFTSLGSMLYGYGNSWRRIADPFYTQSDPSYMYLGKYDNYGINGSTDWGYGDYNQHMLDDHPTESGLGLTPIESQEIKVSITGHEDTDVHFEWGEEGTGMNNTTTSQPKTTTGTFNETISGLQPNTTYEYRAVATNASGTVYGTTQTFTTSIAEPTVQTDSANNITASSGEIRGNLTDLGGENTDVRFNWGTSSTNLSNTTGWTTMSSTGIFSNNLTGLDPNRDYYFQAEATNSAGTTTGSVNSFTTEIDEPRGETDPATNIGTGQADFQGSVNYLGGAPSVSTFFEWGQQGAGMNNTTGTQSVSSIGSFSLTMTGLDPNTTYEYRAAIQNSAGTDYGTAESFTTEIDEPEVTTNSATNTDTTETDIQGELTYLGGDTSTNVWFEWGEQGTGMNNTTMSENKLSPETFSNNISGLDPYTTYEYRAVASNASGTVYGTTETVTTDSAPPRVYTQTPIGINIDTGDVTLRGDLTYTGGYDQVDVYFEWGQSETSLTNQTTPEIKSSKSSFSETINTTLQLGETYYYRAVADNPAGIDEGEVVSFTVADSEGSIILEFNEDQKEIKIHEDGRIEIIN
jgi:hypothetical protein